MPQQPTGRTPEYKYSDDYIKTMLNRAEETYGVCSPRTLQLLDAELDEDVPSPSQVMRRFGLWSKAKDAAGVDEELSAKEKVTGRHKVWTDDQIVFYINECARQNEGRCTLEMYRECATNSDEPWPSPTVAITRFDGWTRAKKQAGLEHADEWTRSSRPRMYTNDEYIELIKKCNERHGTATQQRFTDDANDYNNTAPDTPTVTNPLSDAERDDLADLLGERPHPSVSAIQKRFGDDHPDHGGWAVAKQQAGLPVHPTKFTDQELLDMLTECHAKYGTASAARFAADDDFCSPETVQRRFESDDDPRGGWQIAKEHANVP